MEENILHVTRGKKRKKIATMLTLESMNQNGIRKKN